MPLVILGLTLIAAFYLLKITVSSEFASVALAVLSLLVTLTYQECRYILGLDQDAALESPNSYLSRTMAALASWLQYLDLAFLILAVTLIGVTIYDAFVASVDDLVLNGFLTFNRDTDGYVHLQTYLGGFVFMPLMVFVLGGYGFQKGFIDGSGSFPRFLIALFVGALMALGLLYVAHGESSATANTELLAHANPQAIPMGAKPLAVFNSLGTSALFLVCLAAFAWFCSLIGRLIRTGTDRLKRYKRRK